MLDNKQEVSSIIIIDIILVISIITDSATINYPKINITALASVSFHNHHDY